MINFLKRMDSNKNEEGNKAVTEGTNPGDVTVTENANGLGSAGDQGSEEHEEVAEADNSVAKYRMLHPTNRKDASGTDQIVPAGSIVELPVTYGDSLVAQGQAELVETEEVVE